MTDPHRPYVLVVDDDEDMRDVVTSFVELLDVDTAQAQDGLAALDVVKQRMPDLILLDMKMPVMDGWAFCRALDQTTAHRPPVVVMTAAPDPAQRAGEVGAQAWIGKPFDGDALLDVVRRFLPNDVVRLSHAP